MSTDIRTDYCPYVLVREVRRWLDDGHRLPTHSTDHPAHCRHMSYQIMTGGPMEPPYTASEQLCADCAEDAIRNPYVTAFMKALHSASFHAELCCKACGRDLSNPFYVNTIGDLFVPMSGPR